MRTATLQDPRTQGKDTWGKAQMYAIDIIGDLNHGAEGWIEWNVLLDSSGGPTCVGPTATTVCTPAIGHCDAPLLYDTKKGELIYRDTYHIMAHFSRYIRRGSRVVKSTVKGAQTGAAATTGLQVVAVADPTGKNKLVVVVLNPDPKERVAYKLDIGGGRIAALAAPPRSIQTILVPAV